MHDAIRGLLPDLLYRHDALPRLWRALDALAGMAPEGRRAELRRMDRESLVLLAAQARIESRAWCDEPSNGITKAYLDAEAMTDERLRAAIDQDVCLLADRDWTSEGAY